MEVAITTATIIIMLNTNPMSRLILHLNFGTYRAHEAHDTTLFDHTDRCADTILE